MDTLRERLVELADDAPTGGASAADLWARGRRVHRARSAALAFTLLAVVAVGTGLGVRLAGGDDDAGPVPAGPDRSRIDLGFALPIRYPAGEDLPDLGDAPGPLAAVWLVPHFGKAPEVVGLVAETGVFGTLPIELPEESDPQNPDPFRVALSADGRRIATPSPTNQVGVVIHDLTSGESDTPDIATRLGYTWLSATRLLGHVASGGDADGWAWEPGIESGFEPERVNPYLEPYAGTDLAVAIPGGGPRECQSTILQDLQVRRQNPGEDWAGAFGVPMLCDVLGVTGDKVLLGHWNSDRAPGDWSEPDDANRTVVALDIRGAEVVCPPARPVRWTQCVVSGPGSPRVVVTARAPDRVALATDLVAQALEAPGGPS